MLEPAFPNIHKHGGEQAKQQSRIYLEHLERKPRALLLRVLEAYADHLVGAEHAQGQWEQHEPVVTAVVPRFFVVLDVDDECGCASEHGAQRDYNLEEDEPALRSLWLGVALVVVVRSVVRWNCLAGRSRF